jgi:hypothetical protein
MRLVAVALVALTASTAARAADPLTWRDPETGCSYVVSERGVTPRLRRDGLPDCPGSREPATTGTPSPAALPSNELRDLTRAVETLRREVERLSERIGRR